MRGLKVELQPLTDQLVKVVVSVAGMTIGTGHVPRDWLRTAALDGMAVMTTLTDPIDDQLEMHSRMPWPADPDSSPVTCFDCGGLLVGAETPSRFDHADDDATSAAMARYTEKMRDAQQEVFRAGR